MSWTRKSRPSQKRVFRGKHRFEHWYRDNQIYFITAKCREGFAAFRTEEAKRIFWEKLEQYATAHGFTLIIVTLMSNHYHVLGYLRLGSELGEMMRKIHGSVAKLVNDTLEVRLRPFWFDKHNHKDYFDGCLRDELQMARTFRYIQRQAKRHGICDPKDYRHTRIYVELDRALKRATELGAFLYGVPYKRYERGR